MDISSQSEAPMLLVSAAPMLVHLSLTSQERINKMFFFNPLNMR